MKRETSRAIAGAVSRRTLLRRAAAAGLVAGAGPWIISARGETPIKIGMIDPQTGTYAATGQSEINGAKLAVEMLNKKNGLLGRPIELLVEDSAADVGIAVQKSNKLIDRDGVTFLAGSVSSAVSLAVSQLTHNKKMLYMCTGGHTDPVTGSNCHWNTFRICANTFMLAAAMGRTMFEKFGKKWYFITPDYAFGHTLEQGFREILKGLGGTVLGSALAPLGTTDFSSYLIQARAAKPDVLILLPNGNDAVNALKQAVQFGLNKQMAIGGGLQELEIVAALPPESRFGWWVFEWWWDQPNTPHVKEFVAAYRKAYNDTTPSARSWFGYAGLHAIALGAEKAKSVDNVKVARALEGMVLPPEVALGPNNPAFRAGDHQLMLTLYPGEVPSGTQYPHFFKPSAALAGQELAKTPEQEGCKLDYPA